MNLPLLDAVLAAVLPADPASGLPSAADIGFAAYARVHRVEPVVDAFLAKLEQAPADFAALDAAARLQAVLVLRQRELRVFSAFITEVFRAYYSSPMVLQKLGVGASPPFPEGNTMPDDDWSLLEPVFERAYPQR